MPLANTSHGEIHYKDYRSEDTKTPPLLLIHGAGGTYHNWPPQIRRGLGAIAVDLSGHGGSPPPGRQTIAAYAADIVALLDMLEIKQAVIAGHSMGGAIAQYLALEHPAYVRGLMLLATGARLPVNDVILNGIIEKPRETAELLMKWMWAKHLRDQYAAQGVELLLEIPVEVIRDDYLACHAFNVLDRLHEISKPTLILAGTIDKMTPLAWSQQLASGISGSLLIPIDNGGHMFVLEQPDVVTEVMRKWLATTFD